MLNIGAGEIGLILVAALLILGPKRLPELARAVGKFIREFRRQTDDVRVMVEREFYRMEEPLVKALDDAEIGPPKQFVPPNVGTPDEVLHAHDHDHAPDPELPAHDHGAEPPPPAGEPAKAAPAGEVVPTPQPPPTAVSRERARELTAAEPAAAEKKGEG